jgi:CBS domain-containing protein
MPASSTLSTKLTLTPIQTILSTKEPSFDLATDALMSDCLSLMAEHQIICIPVYKQPVPFGAGKSYKGIVTISDILAKTVFL